MSIVELRDKLNDILTNCDDHFGNYDVVYHDTSDDSDCMITKIVINKKDKLVKLTNNNKYKWYDK